MAEQPTLFSTPPLLRDALITESSKIQDQTVRDCLPFLKGDVIADPEQIGRKGLPKLLREAHVEYLVDSLSADFPVPYDAVRPWLVYWALAGLTTLGEDVTSYRDRY